MYKRARKIQNGIFVSIFLLKLLDVKKVKK